MSRRPKLTLELPQIKKMYEGGMSTQEIADAANVTRRHIYQLLVDNGVTLRPRGHWKRKFHFNEDYFKHWSPNMAYILGFFLADGVISKDTQSVSISQKDRTILEQIKKEIETDQPIGKMNNGVHFLNIHSKIIKEDLITLHGITPNKSLTVTFPYVPEEFMHHFVRGYFDGDGSIEYRKYTVTFVGGSEQFLLELERILKLKGIDCYLKKQKTHFRLFISGRKAIQLFANWIYQNKTFYLERKYAEFKKEKQPISKLEDRMKITKEAVLNRKMRFLEHLKRQNCIEYACKEVCIHQSTFKRWLKEDSAFKKNYEDINIKGG